MAKFKVVVGWKHTIVDTAEVEVTAKSHAEACKKALKKAEACPGIPTEEWRDGEITDGNYIVVGIGPARGRKK